MRFTRRRAISLVSVLISGGAVAHPNFPVTRTDRGTPRGRVRLERPCRWMLWYGNPSAAAFNGSSTKSELTVHESRERGVAVPVGGEAVKVMRSSIATQFGESGV